MNLSNPDIRRGLRSVLQAVIIIAILALLFWQTGLLANVPAALLSIARLLIAILILDTVFYGAENVTRAIKLTGPAGTSLEFGDDAPAAAQAVADTAQATADTIKEAN